MSGFPADGTLKTGTSSDRYMLASSSVAGATQIILDRTPTNLVAGYGFVVIDPFSTNCEVRKVASVSGTTLTLGNVTSLTNQPLQFISSSKTIRNTRGITQIAGDGSTATVTTDTIHPWIVGDVITIYGSKLFNGGTYLDAISATIATTPTTTSFTFASAVNATETVSGYFAGVLKGSPAALWLLHKDYKVKVTGSASNNGTYTVNSVFRYTHDGVFTLYATDPHVITVAESLVDEGAASPPNCALTTDLNIAHASGVPVFWVPLDETHASWYGVSPSATAAQNVTQLHRAIHDCYTQGAGRIVMSAGSPVVNEPIYLEKGITYKFANPDASGLSASKTGVWASGVRDVNDSIMIAARDGDRSHFDGGASPRQFIEGAIIGGGAINKASGTDGVTNGTNTFTAASASFVVGDVGKSLTIYKTDNSVDGSFRVISAVGSGTSVTVSGDVLPSATGLNWILSGMNGILASQQQPAMWRNLRVNSCTGYGICITDIQQLPMQNIELIGNGVAFLCRTLAEFVYIDNLNMEASLAMDFRGDTGPVACQISNYHCESQCTVCFDLIGASNFVLDNGFHSNPATGSHLKVRGLSIESTYQVRSLHCSINQPTYNMVSDAYRNINITSDTADTNRDLFNFTAPAHNFGSLSPIGYPGLRMIGMNGREVALGGQLGGNNVGRAAVGGMARLYASTDRGWASFDASNNEVFSTTLDGTRLNNIGQIRFCTGVPSNAIGVNGDIMFRSDGGVGTTIYQRRIGVYVGVA